MHSFTAAVRNVNWLKKVLTGFLLTSVLYGLYVASWVSRDTELSKGTKHSVDPTVKINEELRGILTTVTTTTIPLRLNVTLSTEGSVELLPMLQDKRFAPGGEMHKKVLEKMHQDLEIEQEELKFSSFERPTLPKRKLILLITTWRSGSTFISEILASHPGMFYHYEPLIYLSDEETLLDSFPDQAMEVVSNLLKCHYSPLDRYLNAARKISEVMKRNQRLWYYCDTMWNSELCYDPFFLTKACSIFPYQLMKLVRVKLEHVEQLWDDPELADKLSVVLLVRDPRGIMNSRIKMQWCTSDVCKSSEYLCSILEDNNAKAEVLSEQYPGKFTVVRYEDLARDPYNMTRKLFHNLGLLYTPRTQHYLDKHTQKNVDQAWTTYRVSNTRVELWKKDLTFEQISDIQRKCYRVLDYYGYRTYRNESELSLDSVLEFNFTRLSEYENR